MECFYFDDKNKIRLVGSVNDIMSQDRNLSLSRRPALFLMCSLTSAEVASIACDRCWHYWVHDKLGRIYMIFSQRNERSYVDDSGNWRSIGSQSTRFDFIVWFRQFILIIIGAISHQWFIAIAISELFDWNLECMHLFISFNIESKTYANTIELSTHRLFSFCERNTSNLLFWFKVSISFVEYVSSIDPHRIPYDIILKSSTNRTTEILFMQRIWFSVLFSLSL